MESNEVSRQEIQVYLSLQNGSWLTNEEISQKTKIPGRTVRFKTKKFVDLGLCDVAEVFPAHRYRLSPKADKRNQAYIRRLEAAREVFGL